MTDNFAWMYHAVYEPPYRANRRKLFLRRAAYTVAGMVMAVAVIWALNLWRMT